MEEVWYPLELSKLPSQGYFFFLPSEQPNIPHRERSTSSEIVGSFNYLQNFFSSKVPFPFTRKKS